MISSTGKKVWASQPAASVKARNKLIEENIGLARRVAHKWARLSHLEYGELESAALEELVKAAGLFEEDRQIPFLGFAMQKINWGVLNYIRDKGNLVRIPRQEYDLNQKAKRIERQLEVEFGRRIQSTEVAFKMGIDHAKLVNAKTAMTSCKKLGTEEVLHLRPGGCDQMQALPLHADWSALTEKEKRTVNLFFNNSNQTAAKLLRIEVVQLLEIVTGAIAKVRINAVLAS